MSPALFAAALMAFPALVIAGAIADLTSFRIPNAISLSLAAAFIPAAALGLMSGVDPATLGLNLAAGAAALVIGVAMFALRWIGGGDAKLFAAAALWIGWPAALSFIGATALAGGALALVLLALRSGYLRPLAIQGPSWVARLAQPDEAAPYGVAIAAGALAAFPMSALARAAQLG